MQRPVKEVSGSVMCFDGAAAVSEDSQGDGVTNVELGLRWNEVAPSSTDLLHA